MSSTTERSRGQALAIFALSLSVLIGAAALAFDGGMIILERRDQQNAADAAAMAGARYVVTDEASARAIATDVATANGFTNGAQSQLVSVNIPPSSGAFVNWDNAIEVVIRNTRPSLFAGVMGILDWPVSARAVAAQLDGAGAPFAILALHPTQCASVLVSGNGDITATGDVQVNSDCPSDALKRQGGGDITVTAGRCNVHGGIQDGGGQGKLDCEAEEFSYYVPDPLETLPDVPQPGPAGPVTPEPGTTKAIPDACPGGADPATEAAPAVCQFNSSYAGTAWRLRPGLYPGGIHLQAGTFYLEPGIYWIGGGGLKINGNGTTTKSVDVGMTDLGGGVLIFNSALPHSVAPTSPLGPVDLDGASANIYLKPLQRSTSPNFGGLVLYQDRHYWVAGDDITINGNDSDGMDVSGTIYAPNGDVKVNGNEGQLTLDQIIALTFKVNGSTGSQVLALKDPDEIFPFYAAGLVE